MWLSFFSQSIFTCGFINFLPSHLLVSNVLCCFTLLKFYLNKKFVIDWFMLLFEIRPNPSRCKPSWLSECHMVLTVYHYLSGFIDRHYCLIDLHLDHRVLWRQRIPRCIDTFFRYRIFMSEFPWSVGFLFRFLVATIIKQECWLWFLNFGFPSPYSVSMPLTVFWFLCV